jgi:cysteine desulfurase
MAAVWGGPLGNPTGSHPPAQRSRRLLEEARDEVADFLGRSPGEIIFTSGGTESANLAIAGTVERPEGAPALLSSAVEHPAVREACRAAARRGVAWRELAVDADGVVDVEAASEQLAAATGPVLVAVMVANNETGVVQPVVELARRLQHHRHPSRLFSDAVQAAPFVDLAAVAAGADLVSLSAHKVGGPVGTGVLAVRPPEGIAPLLHGGGQERARRSGTQDTAGAVGLATALRLVRHERDECGRRVAALRDELATGLLTTVSGVYRTVPAERTLPGHLHLCFEGVDREELLVALGARGVCASGGSSCASGALEPSHVLAAMGVPEVRARGAIRFTLGHGTTAVEVAHALACVPEAVDQLRRAR